MAATALAAAALMGQAAFSLALEAPATPSADVAYSELSQGQADSAVAKLEAAVLAAPNDPAALINLGTAYARTGQTDKALRAYGAAIASSERYDLELADGTWMDSRRAALVARDRLLGSAKLATRR